MPDVLLNNPDELTVGAEGVAEILQNVRVIVATPKGSVPLDREFGVSWSMVDEPTIKAKATMTGEIFEQVSKYEPRARVTGVDWDESPEDEMEGRIRPRIQLEIVE